MCRAQPFTDLYDHDFSMPSPPQKARMSVHPIHLITKAIILITLEVQSSQAHALQGKPKNMESFAGKKNQRALC
jgi:hypothetical protein